MLYRLPTELVLCIAEQANALRDVNSIAQTCSRFYQILNRYLYSRDAIEYRSSALLWAAKHGQIPTARKALDGGAQINTTRLALSANCGPAHSKFEPLDSWWTPLFLATANYCTEMADFLLGIDGRDVNARDSRGRTLLAEAAGVGNETMVRLLLSQPDIDPNALDSLERTPLMIATIGGFVGVVQLLLEHKGVNVNASGQESYYTAMYVAATCGRIDIVRMLRAAGADLDIGDGLHDPVLREMGDWRLWVVTPLGQATKQGHEDIVRFILQQGGFLPRRFMDVYMLFAARSGYVGIVEAYLPHLEDANVRSYDGRPALWWAAMFGNEQLVETLLGVQGIDVDAASLMPQDRWVKQTEQCFKRCGGIGITARMVAAEQGHAGVVRLLENAKSGD